MEEGQLMGEKFETETAQRWDVSTLYQVSQRANTEPTEFHKTAASNIVRGIETRVINLIRSSEMDLISRGTFIASMWAGDARLGTGFCPLAKYRTIPLSSHNQSDTFLARVWFKKLC